MTSPINSAVFTKSTDTLYNYFTSVGINGKTANLLVTEDLTLQEKPTWILRVFQRIFGKICFFCPSTPNISSVIIKIETLSRRLEDIDTSTKEKAAFVVDILKIIQQKKDSSLTILSKINELSHLIEHAQIDNKSKYRKFEAKLLNSYKTAKPFDPKNKVPATLQQLKQLPSVSWDSLSRDVARKIFSCLGPVDLTQLRGVSHNWSIFASDKLTWINAKNNPEHSLIFSALKSTQNPFTAFQNSRALERSIRTNKPNHTTINTLHSITKSNQYYLSAAEYSVRSNDFLCVLKHRDGSYILYEKCVVKYQKPANSSEVFDGEKLYLLSANTHAISAHQVDTTHGETTLVWKNPGANVALSNVSNSKLYCILHNHSAVIYDMKTGSSEIADKEVAQDYVHGARTILSGHYLYKSAGNTLCIQNLEDLTKKPITIADITAQTCNMYAASTTLFIISSIGNIVAYCMQTGKMLAIYPVQNENTSQILVSNGLLFAQTSESRIQVYDILTTKFIKTIDHCKGCVSFAVHDKKIIYVDRYTKSVRSVDFS